MLVKFAKDGHTLAANNVLSGQLEQAQVLQVDTGRVWLTVEGQADDYWLQAGETCTLPAKRLLVIEADKTVSHFHFEAVPAAGLRGIAGPQMPQASDMERHLQAA